MPSGISVTHGLVRAAALCAMTLLGGCDLTVLDPHGQVGVEEKSIIITATALMLIVVVPVIIMVFAFAWRYRSSNIKATFAPDWAHSGKIEAVVWVVPCIIIAILASLTWTSSHRLDPYRHIASTAEPINIEVVSLNWKWLFIYPDLHIASVNQIAFPTGVPVNFSLTSDSIMNSFFIPQLGGQIYTMAGMDTKLSLIADAPGSYDGASANYSGAGFSDMKFTAIATDKDGFAKWVAQVKASPTTLGPDSYRLLTEPSEKNPVAYFSNVDATLYHDILNQCVGDANRCMDMKMKMTMAPDSHAAMVMSPGPNSRD